MTTEKKTMTKQEEIEYLYVNDTCKQVAYKLLLSLAKKGNMTAYDILSGKNNGLITYNDLSQTMLLFLIEHENNWQLIPTSFEKKKSIIGFEKIEITNKNGSITTFEIPKKIQKTINQESMKISFNNDETQKEFFRIVSNELYNNIRKHDRKKLWIELDNELVKIDDIPSLASHTCIDNVMTLSLYNQFTSYLFSTKPKQADRYIQAIKLRLQGYKYKEIASTLNIKDTSVKKDFQVLKKLWKEFNK